MKFIYSFAFAIFILNISSIALAGGMEGGGGKSVVCRDLNGNITKAELLDLFEGRTQYQLPYQESPLPWKEQVVAIFNSAGVSTVPSPNEQTTIFDWYNRIITRLNILPDDVTLKDTVDSFEVVAPRNCKIEQVAIYQNDNQVLVNGEIWNFFSETQKAALMIHESSYKVLRKAGETNSIRARHFTAHLMSNGKIEDNLPENTVVAMCGVPGSGWNTYFYVSPSFYDENGVKRARVQFGNIGKQQLLSKTYADVDVSSLDKELWENVINPTEVFAEIIELKSLFESGVQVSLWIAPRENEKMFVTVSGYDKDGTSFSSEMTCFKKPKSALVR